MSTTLYRKYRPQVFDDVIGQEHIITTLKRAISAGRVAHAYLFTGPRGVGKTTVARLVAKAVNCIGKGDKPCGKCPNCLAIADGNFIDLIEIDAASNRGIDEIRELRDKIKFSPSTGAKKVYIIDEVHMLTREAFNALLKTLEEPPDHTIFIFATTEIHKVPQTVSSRCQQFDFNLGDKEAVKKSLGRIIKDELWQLDDGVLEIIVKASGGSYRDAHSLLDQLSSHLGHGSLSAEQALSILHLTSLEQVYDLIQFLKEKNLTGVLNYFERLKEKGTDFEGLLKNLILEIRREAVEKILAQKAIVWEVVVLRRLLEAAREAKISPVDSLPLELAAIDICAYEGENEPPNNQENRKEEKKATAVDAIQKKDDELPPPPDFKELFSAEGRMAVIESISQKNKTLGSLLGMCEWKEGKGKLIFEVQFALHKEKILDKKCVKLIEEVVQNICGKTIPVDCKVISRKELDEDIGEVFGVAES